MASDRVARRKEDLKRSLQVLNEECDTATTYISEISKAAQKLVSDLQKETNVTFLQKYASVNAQLTELVSSIVKFNCELEVIREPSSTFLELENVATGCVQRQVSSTVLQIQKYRKFPEKIVLPRFLQKQVAEKCISEPYIQEGDTIDMAYVRGDNPWDFWLRYPEEKFAALLSDIQKRNQEKRLKPLTATPEIGRYVCGYSGKGFFRGRVTAIKQMDSVCKFMVLDVDMGIDYELKLNDICFLDDDLRDVHVHALNCKLSGQLGEPSLWNDAAGNMFKQFLLNSALKVRVCSVMAGSPVKYVVAIDSCNYINGNKTDVGTIISNFVIPVLNSTVSKLQPLTEDEKLNKGCIGEVENISFTGPTVNPAQKSRQSQLSRGQTPVLVNSLPQQSACGIQSSSSEGAALYTSESCPSVMGDKEKRCSTPLKFVPQQVPLPKAQSLPQSLVADAQQLRSSSRDIFSSTWKVDFHRIGLNLQGAEGRFQEHDAGSLVRPATMSTALSVSKEGCLKEDFDNSTLSPKTSSTGISMLEEQVVIPSSMHLESGRTYSVRVSFVLSPGEFYVHVVNENKAKANQLYEEMKQYYAESPLMCYTTKELARSDIGQFCVCYYSPHKVWYRAKVVDWDSCDRDTVTVNFIDCGMTFDSKLSNIQPLHQLFAKLPAIAIRCHLADVQPLKNNMCHGNPWGQQSCAELKSFIKSKGSYTVFVKGMNGLSSFSVLLKNEDKECINDKLVISGAVIKTIEEDVQEGAVMWNPMVEEFTPSKTKAIESMNDTHQAVTKLVPQEDQDVCTFLTSGWCSKEKKCSKAHDPMDWTPGGKFVYVAAFAPLVLPEEGDTVIVHVTNPLGINCFHGIIISELNNTEVSHQSEKTVEKPAGALNALVDEINDPANINNLCKLDSPPALYQVVLSLFFEDNKWYRAKVIELSDDESQCVKVRYVDYGNVEWVQQSRIRDIEPKFLELPFQAVEFELCNMASGSDISQEELEKAKIAGVTSTGNTFSALVIKKVAAIMKLEVIVV